MKRAAEPLSHGRRVVYDITGIVQGVGFRPTLCRLAQQAGLGGSVQNRTGSVRLVLEGDADALQQFMAAWPGALPPSAQVQEVVQIADEPLSAPPVASFQILASAASATTELLIPADLALCPDCAREVLNPAERRYGYPFTTCTRCGPRYTVVHGMPYDRERTTLCAFPLCSACQREYDDPADRRFHAESMACPVCGPRVWLEDAQGAAVPGEALRQVRAALAAGAVVALRGVGGFLLAVDATNRRALAELRRRKNRPHKPFAVLARTPAVVTQVCQCGADTARLLAAPLAPIVILDLRPDQTILPVRDLSPDTATLGVMLPTTPLHLLLATPLAGDPTPPFDWLVMTSGNRGGEPICITNAEARERLCGIADFFLLHNREINLRCDDSICLPVADGQQVWRRARGLAPEVLRLAHRLSHSVLAMGAELKNTIALGFDDRVVLSPHIGDLEAPEAVEGLRQVAEALPRFVQRAPACVAVDLHPDLHSSRVGREMARCLGIPVVPVQHHHAHAAACLGEHGLQEGLALVFDGTGLGADGQIWGAELLHVQGGGYRRLASFTGVPLPGGDAAVRQPLRQLAGRCVAAGMDLPQALRTRLAIRDEAWQVWRQQSVAGVQAPITHAAGRMFDTMAVALGVASGVVTYEGQTAIRLEAAAAGRVAGERVPELPYLVRQEGDMLWVDWQETIRYVLTEGPVASDRSPFSAAAWAYGWHVALAQAAATMVRQGRAMVGTAGADVVALSGGVFMNRLLTALLVPQLSALGVRVIQHRHTPPNDGGIAMGQVLVAGGRW